MRGQMVSGCIRVTCSQLDELAEADARHRLSYDDFISPRFVRLRRIRELLSAGLVDETLRHQISGPFPMPGAEIAHEAR